MGRQIVKQPNGKFAIFSSITDSFIILDVTPEEYIRFRIKEESKQIWKKVTEIVEELNRGEKPYYQFTFEDFQDALDHIAKIHGKNSVEWKEAAEYLKAEDPK